MQNNKRRGGESGNAFKIVDDKSTVG